MLDMNLQQLIHCAASQHNVQAKQITDAVRHRIQTHPEEVNQQGLLGLTPCHLAAIIPLPDILEILVLEGKADLSILDNHNQTPIESAASKQIKEQLIELARKAKRLAPPVMAASSSSKTTPKEITRTLSHRLRRNTGFLDAVKGHERAPSALPTIGKIPQYKQVPPLSQLDLTATSMENVEQKMEQLEIVSDHVVNERERSILKTTPKQRYLKPFLKALNAERIELMQQYLQEGYLLNDFTELTDQSVLLYTFKMGLSKAFSQLLLHGVSLRSDNLFNHFRASLSGAIQSIQQCHMLIVAQNNLLEKIDWEEIKRTRSEIHKLSGFYNEQLVQQGLQQDIEQKAFSTLSPDSIDRLAREKLLPPQLLNDLYCICSCLEGVEKDAGEMRRLNPTAITNVIAGLSAQYRYFDIAAALLQLQAHFSKAQRLIMLYVLKEMVMSQLIYQVQDLKIFSAMVVPAFFKENEDKEFQELLQCMALIKSKSSETQLDNYAFLESMIQHHIPSVSAVDFRSLLQLTSEKTNKRAVEVASALRAHTLMLFHDLNIDELTSLDWNSNRKRHLAPTVNAVTNYFNCLSHWLTRQILEQTELTQRTRFVKLCIKTINELIESEVPDYTSAMAIFSALNQASISRLSETFGLLDRKTRKMFERLSEITLSPHRNYQAMRVVLEQNRYALPYIGIATSDLVFSQENKNSHDKALMVGKIVNSLLAMKQALKLLHLPITTNVANIVNDLVTVEDKILYQRSLKLEPRPFVLSDEYLVNELKADLETIKRNRSTFKVNINAMLVEDKAAFSAFIEWLKKGYLEDKLEITEFEELATIAHSIISTDTGYKFNAVYYQTLKQSPQPIIVQFQRSTVSLNATHSEKDAVTLSHKEAGALNLGRKQF